MSEAAPSKSRRLARELAFQACYMTQIGATDPDTAIQTTTAQRPLAKSPLEFMTKIVQGVAAEHATLDEMIEPLLAAGWTLKRLAVSDLTALRVAAYEFFHMPGVPPKVTITEAVELAKRFGTKDSGSFVHGVLGTLLKQSPKADWDPAQEEKHTEMDADDLVPPTEPPQTAEAEESDQPSPWQIKT